MERFVTHLLFTSYSGGVLVQLSFSCLYPGLGRWNSNFLGAAS